MLILFSILCSWLQNKDCLPYLPESLCCQSHWQWSCSHTDSIQKSPAILLHSASDLDLQTHKGHTTTCTFFVLLKHEIRSSIAPDLWVTQIHKKEHELSLWISKPACVQGLWNEVHKQYVLHIYICCWLRVPDLIAIHKILSK